MAPFLFPAGRCWQSVEGRGWLAKPYAACVPIAEWAAASSCRSKRIRWSRLWETRPTRPTSGDSAPKAIPVARRSNSRGGWKTPTCARNAIEIRCVSRWTRRSVKRPGGCARSLMRMAPTRCRFMSPGRCRWKPSTWSTSWPKALSAPTTSSPTHACAWPAPAAVTSSPWGRTDHPDPMRISITPTCSS